MVDKDIRKSIKWLMKQLGIEYDSIEKIEFYEYSQEYWVLYTQDRELKEFIIPTINGRF